MTRQHRLFICALTAACAMGAQAAPGNAGGAKVVRTQAAVAPAAPATQQPGPEYKLGLLELRGSDPLAAGTWVKSAEPLFQQDPESRVFGPAHNGFFKSPDGAEDWMVYHANDNPNAGCYLARTTRAQPNTWTPEGTPRLGVPLPLSSANTAPAGE